MSTFVILIPSFLTDVRFGYLYGFHSEDSAKKTEVFYALDVGYQMNKECIGYISSKSYDDSLVGSQECAHWFSMKVLKDEFIVTNIKSSDVELNLNNCKGIIIMVYNYSKFLKSELLVKNWSNKRESEDYCQELVKHISKRNTCSNVKRRNKLSSAFHCFLYYLVIFTSLISITFSKLNPILKYSSTGTHCKNFFESLYWALSSMKKERKISIKVGNYILATLFDVCAGLFFLNWLISTVAADSLPQLLLDTAEVVVETLLHLLKWLMGVPAGLKLNFAWNNMLGKFFMYHINLWWTFLAITRPLLNVTFGLFMVIGQLGLSFQVSILTDLLALVSFHVYCIYVYAARLYNLQVMGLVALWRLILGQKWNPLRERVDSCKYSSEQLFLGTLAFTILFFLLPTTVMYYTVFASLRVATLAVGGCLNRIRLLVHSLPLYSSFLWITGGDSITSTIQLLVHPSNWKTVPGEIAIGTTLSQQITLSVTLTSVSWWSTVCTCVPNPVHSGKSSKDPKLEWSCLLGSLFYGRLIYPV